MRILVLGAGALGGYFGGRLLEAGADVSFLVRPRRRAQLERDGLAIESPFGALRRRVPLLSPGEAAPGWDVRHLEREWRDWVTEPPRDPEAAFDRLLGMVKAEPRAKERLLELLKLLEPSDPRVIAARTRLASALF